MWAPGIRTQVLTLLSLAVSPPSHLPGCNLLLSKLHCKHLSMSNEATLTNLLSTTWPLPQWTIPPCWNLGCLAYCNSSFSARIETKAYQVPGKCSPTQTTTMSTFHYHTHPFLQPERKCWFSLFPRLVGYVLSFFHPASQTHECPQTMPALSTSCPILMGCHPTVWPCLHLF